MAPTRRAVLAGAIGSVVLALKPENPVVGGTVLRRQAVQSPNYSPGVAGWTIKQDGSAEFNNLTIRGTFNGNDFVLNNTGFFLYSAAPAAGNLFASVTNFAGTDAFGNIYLPGSASYSTSQAVANELGVLIFYTGSLAAGWAQQGIIQADTTNAGQIDAQGAWEVSGNLIVQGTTITASGVTAVDLHQATIDVHNGNVNLNMASPPNYPTSGKTLAQTQACLDGLIGSMINRQLVA